MDTLGRRLIFFYETTRRRCLLTRL